MFNSQGAARRAPVPKIELTCDCGCNQKFLRYRSKVGRGLNFKSPQHRGAYDSAKNLREKTGPHETLVREYLEGPAKRLYTDHRSLRKLLLPFFEFLCQTDVTGLKEVTSTTITEYKCWAPQNGYKAAGADTSLVGTFFEWARHSGYYDASNPVVLSVHGRVRKKSEGRPYTVEEIRHMRALLAKCGNDRLRAFFELALASGLRSNELCQLRLSDVRLDEKDLVVGLPNKTRAERRAFFDDLVYDYLTMWLKVRRSDCDHDFFFHNSIGSPLSTNVIKREFNRVLCEPSAIYPHPIGLLDEFDLHRLRHTGASNFASVGMEANTLATLYGWAAPQSRDGYVRVDEQCKVKGFVTAMDEINSGGSNSAVTILSNKEFLASIGA